MASNGAASALQRTGIALDLSIPEGVPANAGEVRHLGILELDPEDKKDFEEWIQVTSKLRIMVAGETGVGKSTLLNGLVGQEVCEVGRKDKQRVTTKVSEFNCQKDGIDIIAIDCPGLHDGTDNDDQYVRDMKGMIDSHDGIDLMLYCKRMDDTRASAADSESDVKSDADIIRKLSDGLGKEIWEHTLFVLTFANVYEKMLKQRLHPGEVQAAFKDRKDAWKKEIQKAMKACEVEYGRVKVCAAGHKKPQLCGSQYWLSDFWATAYEVQDENGAFALLRLNKKRMVDLDAAEAQCQATSKEELHRQPIVMTDKVKKALGAVGVGTGAGVGTAIGATVGATIGAVGIGVVSFGPAAGIGLVLGGAIGAAVGTAIGGSILALYKLHKAKKALKQSSESAKK